MGVPHHAAHTGVTGPALTGGDSKTPFGIPGIVVIPLSMASFGAAHGAHPASAPSWHWFVLEALGRGCWGWLWPSGMGKGLIHEPGYAWRINFPCGSDPGVGDTQESLDLLG